jgi:hypothetical protein
MINTTVKAARVINYHEKIVKPQKKWDKDLEEFYFECSCGSHVVNIDNCCSYCGAKLDFTKNIEITTTILNCSEIVDRFTKEIEKDNA